MAKILQARHFIKEDRRFRYTSYHNDLYVNDLKNHIQYFIECTRNEMREMKGWTDNQWEEWILQQRGAQ